MLEEVRAPRVKRYDYFMGSGSASLGGSVGLMGPIREGESPAEWEAEQFSPAVVGRPQRGGTVLSGGMGGALNEAEQFSPAVVGTVLGMDAGSSFGRYEGLCFPVAQQLLLLHNNCASKPSRV